MSERRKNMATGFNADEVLEMAIHIEQNAAAFYRKAAGLQTDKKNGEFLEGLAAMEDRHQEIFTEMRNTLRQEDKGGTVFDPHGELALYLASMADSLGGEGSPSAADALTGNETLEDIIKTALGLEKDAILFYLGVKNMVPPKYGRDKVEEIIEEERRHVAQLTGVLKKVRTA
jgi:rubrerythrin